MQKYLFLFILLACTSQLFPAESTAPSKKVWFSTFRKRKKNSSMKEVNQDPFPFHVAVPEDKPLFSAHGDVTGLTLTIYAAQSDSLNDRKTEPKDCEDNVILGIKINLNLVTGRLLVHKYKKWRRDL